MRTTTSVGPWASTLRRWRWPTPTWPGLRCWRAARLLGASQASYEAAGLVPDPVDADDPDRMQAAARDRLGADRFARLWEEGRHLSLDRAVAQARGVAG